MKGEFPGETLGSAGSSARGAAGKGIQSKSEGIVRLGHAFAFRRFNKFRQTVIRQLAISREMLFTKG
jgi:hypothetical protein